MSTAILMCVLFFAKVVDNALSTCSDTCVYDICKSDPSFPCLRVGRRVLIPRDKFIDWVEQQVEQRKEENASGVLGAREPFSGYKEAVAYAKLNGKEL